MDSTKAVQEPEGNQDSIINRIPDLESAISQLQRQEIYPFFERLTGLMAMILAGTFLIIPFIILRDLQVGNLEWQTLVSIGFGLAGAPGLIVVPLAVFLTATGRAIGHVNKTGEELRPDWSSPYLTVVEHLFRVLGGAIVFYWIYQKLIMESHQSAVEAFGSLILMITLASIVLLAFGLLISGLSGFVLFLQRMFESK